MDGNVFASGSSDLSFRIWDIRQKNACFRVFDKNECGGISAIKFMPENVNTLAVGYEEKTIKLWDLRAMAPLGTYVEKESKFFDAVKSFSFSKSGRLLFSAYSSNIIKIWDLLTETAVG
jgi:guanine nucleotide-binding protein G(I)/G(S)/G(T) subunit beta-1